VERTTERLVLSASWNGPGEPAVGDLRFVRGDRFLEYYFIGEPYAVWQVERPDGALKGWYCNIETLLRDEGPGVLAFNDLLLDVLAYPDGRYLILDRDEFNDARLQGLSDHDVRLAEAGLSRVLALVSTNAFPFRFSGEPRRIESS
jgi:predicted RNA-binding protein associated with RNAse of E/G family